MSDLARIWPFSRSRARIDADRLLGVVTQISRQPDFFAAGRVADTPDGRLEVLMLHSSLVLVRLQREPALAPLAQAFTDRLFRSLDAGLREMGVGDTAVPKRMRKIAADFYGRLGVYSGALAAADQAALEAAIARNALGVEGAGFAPALARYAEANAALHAASPPDALSRLDGWAPAPA